MFSPQLLCLLYSVQIPNARKVNAISKFPLIRGLPVHRQMDESPVLLPSNRTPILKLHSSVQRHSLAHPQPKLGKSLCPLFQTEVKSRSRPFLSGGAQSKCRRLAGLERHVELSRRRDPESGNRQRAVLPETYRRDAVLHVLHFRQFLFSSIPFSS